MSAALPPAPRPGGGARPRSEWAARGERSNRFALRAMAWIAVTLGRPVARLVLVPITLYFLLAAGGARRNSARYLARVLGRRPSWRERWRHLHDFASTVLDRVYLARGELHRFEIDVEGHGMAADAAARGPGVVMLGAHVGSFEALHAVGRLRTTLRVAMAMYPDNARMIHETLQTLAPGFELGIIAIGRPGSTLAIRDWLDAGGLVGLLGDRRLGGAAGRSAGSGGGVVEIPFLGKPVDFTDGPLRLAQLLRRRVVFMSAVYLGGRRYAVRFDPLADFTSPAADAAQAEARVRDALHAYVGRLEALVRAHPTNWFNFYDYWNEAD